MKKIAILVATLALLSLGLTQAPSATAAGCKDDYTGCIPTKTSVNGKKNVKLNRHGSVRVNLQAKVRASGNVRVEGRVEVTCEGPGKTVSNSRQYRGSATNIKVRLDAAGEWKCTMVFKADDGFEKSRSTTTVTVRPKKSKRA